MALIVAAPQNHFIYFLNIRAFLLHNEELRILPPIINSACTLRLGYCHHLLYEILLIGISDLRHALAD